MPLRSEFSTEEKNRPLYALAESRAAKNKIVLHRQFISKGKYRVPTSAKYFNIMPFIAPIKPSKLLPMRSMADNLFLHRQTISVVLPCYNPIEGWCQALISNINDLNHKLPEFNIQYIVSNDGSTRLPTEEIARLKSVPSLTFLDNPINEGKGSAIRKGTMRAQGQIIIYTDIDFPFGTDSVVEIIRTFMLNPECWFVYGNRSSDYFKKLPLKRQLISKALHFFNRLFLSKHVTDTQAGIKGLRRELLADLLETKTNTFVFEIELIRKLIKKKIEIRKIEVKANPSIVFSDFSFKTIYRETVNLIRITISRSVWSDIL